MAINNKIIFSKTLNGIELLRSLAYFGTNTLGLNFLNRSSLIEYIGGRINYFPNLKVLSKEEQQFAILKILELNKILDVQTFDDVTHVTNTINDIRNSIFDDDLNAFNSYKTSSNISIGSKKLFDIYFDYLNYLLDNGLLDEVSLVFNYLKHGSKCIDTITLLKEETYTPLDLKLVETFSNNIEVISIGDLFQKTNDTKSTCVINPSYGEHNEIREAITYIVENKIPFDQVNFVFTQEGKYFDELYSLTDEYKIPVNFVSGVRITESNPYKLFNYLFTLEDNYFNSVDGYNGLFGLSSFDSKIFTNDESKALIDILGHLKIGFDKEYNETVLHNFLSCKYKNVVLYQYFKDDELAKESLLSKLTDFINDFSDGIISFVEKHCYFRKDDHIVLDQGSMSIIREKYAKSLTITNLNIRRTYIEKLKDILLVSEVSKPGYLSVLTLKNAMSWYRPYTFIFGLSSTYFPGKNVENYLISNNLLKEINKDSITSDDKITKKIESLSSYINTLNSLNIETHLSYSFYSLNEVKSVNPCSIIYALRTDEQLREIIKTKDIRNNKISGYSGFANVVLTEKTDLKKDVFENVEVIKKNLLEQSYSPSQIESFIKCPKSFFIKAILGIKEPEEYDPLDPITHLVYGNIFHKSMEYLKNHNRCSLEEFVENGLNELKDYLCYDVPVFDVSIVISDYEQSLKNIYQIIRDNNFIIVECEKKLTGEYKGIKLNGRFDAIAKRGNEYFVIDYKTGRKVKHNENDIETGFQMMVYFELLKQNDYNVNQGFYIYPRVNAVVSMDLEECDKESFDTQLEFFKDALVNYDFPEAKDSDCTYCKFQPVCGKNVKNFYE